MSRKPQTRKAKIIDGFVKIVPSLLVKLAMILIITVAFITTYLGGLETAHALSFLGLSAMAFAALPDALMVLSAARMRQHGISTHQRKIAQSGMRFGLLFSLLTNMIAAFIHVAPSGYWINESASQAIWLQHMIFVLTIIWHGVPVIILWYSTEMITRPRSEPASIQRSKITSVLIGQKTKTTIPPRTKKINMTGAIAQ